MNSKYLKYDTLVAYDCSYSTSTSCNGFDTTFYHTETQNIVRSLDSSKTLFIRWDEDYTEISKVDLELINQLKKGYGGTSPFKLFQFIKNIGFKGNLIFISDGQIDNQTTQKCSDILLEWNFNNVNIYLIYTGGSINESVSCALTRNSPHEIKIYENINSYKYPSTIKVTFDDINFTYNLDSINTIEEFLEHKKTLKDVLTSINMGTNGSKELHSKLVTLKNRLIKSESKKFEKGDNPVSKLIESFKISTSINTNNLEFSQSELDNVWKLYYKIEENTGTEEDNWETTIDKFISWCSGSLLKTFDRNKISNREVSAVQIPVIPSENVQILEEKLDDLKLTCPILMEESSNMILIMKKTGSSIFDDLPTNLRDSLINCPLNALRNTSILMYIKSLFDCVISIEAYKDLVDYGISDNSPLTRDEIFGGLCLGKHTSHVQATNSTLRYVLTGGKSLGNIDLWFAVIYFIVERADDDYYLKEYLPMIKEHLKYRLLNSKSYMCLSGLPTYPVYSVPLGLASWCSIMATTSKLSLIKDPKNDPIRLHLSYSMELIELLEIIGIHVPNELICHINRLKTLRYFLLEFKKGKEQTMKLKNLIDAMYYNAIETNQNWILIDGKPSDAQITKVRTLLPSVCKDLSITEIKDILDLCNANKAESDIYIPYNYEIRPFVKYVTKNWSFGNNVPYFKVDISPKTCRPYYKVNVNGINSTWLDNAIKIYGHDLFSTNNFFGNYVFENKKYPTKDELLNYIFMYYHTRDKKTLPICIEQFINEVFDEYQDILRTIDPEVFVERWSQSVHKDVRMIMEK